MFDKYLVQRALRHSLNPDGTASLALETQDRLVSLLIHDIFGGEILKTHKKKGWHFYNRINGERIDLVSTKKAKTAEETSFDDLQSAPEESLNYFAQDDYSAFQVDFINAFEEEVGLGKNQTGKFFR